VPKGPSLNPDDKRLAVMVEDHPIEYGSFEGVIPQGNYGAGTVMVWDDGAYGVLGAATREDTEKAVLDGLAKGRLKIVLQGQKLKGEFALFRTGRSDEKNWMLIKHRDPFASNVSILDDDLSAKTGRTLEQIAEAPQYWHSNRAKPELDLADAPAAEMPHNIRPMLAQSRSEAFDDPNWVFEIKWDGFRAIAEVDGSNVRLYSRKNISLAKRFPAIVDSLKRLGHQAVLDGEIVVLDQAGKPQFDLLQNYGTWKRGTLVYYVFDLLYLDGRDLRRLPLTRRKLTLSQIIGRSNVRLCEHVEEHGNDFFELVADQGLEGVIAKDSRSPYLVGRRSNYWLKIKAKRRQEVVIAGFTDERSNRNNIGSLVVGVREGNSLVYVGHVGSGFTVNTLDDLRRRLAPLIEKSCPFQKKPKVNAPVHWVRPTLSCEVSFSDWTRDRRLRQPVFMGLREDAKSSGVQRASNQSEKSTSGNRKPIPVIDPPSLTNGLVRIDGQNVRLSNLEKVYWPADGYTKRNLIEYYASIAEFILPYLRDRPLSLLRHPNGIESSSFFQKDMSAQPPPDWVRSIRLRSEQSEREKQWVTCQDRPTLVYLANLGCIEMNPWNSRIDSLEFADYLLLDLDPVEIAFDELVRAAQEMRRILDQIGAVGYCKTSGKRGLHIYVPLGGRYTHEHAKQFAQLLTHVLHRRLPEITSLVRDPAKRRGRVYLDFLQNGKGKTLAAAYSVRPVPSACVSTPLTWKEVRRGLDPSRFTIKNMAHRLLSVGDLWTGVLGDGIDVQACLERVNQLLSKY
jgi:bifunctional non-homologous end joining protein LigD